MQNAVRRFYVSSYMKTYATTPLYFGISIVQLPPRSLECDTMLLFSRNYFPAFIAGGAIFSSSPNSLSVANHSTPPATDPDTRSALKRLLCSSTRRRNSRLQVLYTSIRQMAVISRPEAII